MRDKKNDGNQGMTKSAILRRGLLASLALMVGLIAVPAQVWAAASNYPMEPMKPNLQDLPSLQNGLRLYANYCLACHSLKFQRYERTANDLGIPHDIVLDNLIFTDQKIGEHMASAMDPESAKDWFGAPPPDLTMVARVRGAEWIYNYLKTFYLDDMRPLGVNNKVFPNVGMPHALIELQGIQREGCIQVPKIAPNGGEMRDPLAPGTPITEEQCGHLVLEEGSGAYTPEEYDRAVYDISNFLYYVGEPSRLERHRLGVYVLLFLLILYAFTWLLGREYHKAVR
jgi:cytochrome c1